MAPSESRFDWTFLTLGDLCQAQANSQDWHFGIAQEDVEANLVFMTEDKATFFFFHFQRTGLEISDARHKALLLDLRQQRTTKATGNAWCLHLRTLSLALDLVWRSQCEHLFFLRLMGTDPPSSPFAADTRLSNWDLSQETDQHNNPFTPDTWLPNWGRESSSAILKPIENLKGLESRTRWEIKRACDGSNKQEALGMSGLWLLLINVENKKCRRRSGSQLSVD